MTHLELVNKVLLRLRESEVDTISSQYSRLISSFVNEAKEDAERAHKWKALRRDITFSTVAGQQDYDLSTGGVAAPVAVTERSQLLYEPMTGEPVVFNLTEPYKGNRLVEMAREAHKAWIADDDATDTQPYWFSLFKVGDGWRVSIYPKPDAVYTIQMSWYIPQEELTADETELTIPADPVWRMALASAASERGAGAGDSAEKYEARAQRALIEAISREAEDAELTFYEA